MEIKDIQIVRDLTEEDAGAGFLQLSRLLLRNIYADGTISAEYRCDIVSREYTDAVALCIYHIDNKRSVKVIMKESPRAPIYLRKHKKIIMEDQRSYLTIIELVAGLLEKGDGDPGGLERRAVAEAEEEAGVKVSEESIHLLGEETFASPGISDEKIYFTSVEVPDINCRAPKGDGSVMEEASRAVVLDLREAIRMCRDGRIPDMKSEMGLLRLADQIGYLAQLDKFVHELPKDLQDQYDRLGLTTG
ncbi:hypothetical protein ACFL54_07905 [Planctomycetota bacterium]